MSDEIKLGELEIRPEQLLGISMNDSPTSVTQYGMSLAQASRVADEVNRILADKLRNAPLVFGHAMNSEWHLGEEVDREFYDSARLVCVEEIKK